MEIVDESGVVEGPIKACIMFGTTESLGDLSMDLFKKRSIAKSLRRDSMQQAIKEMNNSLYGQHTKRDHPKREETT